MKKLFLLTILLLFQVTASAQSQVLTLYKRDGTIVQHLFDDHPRIINSGGGGITLITNTIEVSYPFNDIQKYTLNESKEVVNFKKIVIDNDNIQEYINETDIEDCDITYIRTFNDTEWQSFYVPFDVSPAHFSEEFEFALINNFHQYDDNNDGVFDRVELEIKRCDPTKVLQANYPYLVRAKEPGTKKIEVSPTLLYATEEFSIDCSSVEFLYTFTGSYKSITDLRKKGCYFIDGGYLTKAYSSNKQLEPFRWTMTITARNSQYKESPIIVEPQKIKIKMFGNENETTDIENIDASTSSTPDEIYNINGVRCSTTEKRGLYIIKMKDGSYKKVFIK